MQESTKAATGFRTANRIGEGRAFMGATARVNRQIGSDVYVFACTSRLPDSPPVLPLTQSRPRKKLGILSWCWLTSCAFTFIVVASPFILATAFGPFLVTQPPQAILGGGALEFGATLFCGWLLGLLAWLIADTRENSGHSGGVVLDHYRMYGKARQRARIDLDSCAGVCRVGEHLWSSPIETSGNATVWG